MYINTYAGHDSIQPLMTVRARQKGAKSNVCVRARVKRGEVGIINEEREDSKTCVRGITEPTNEEKYIT